MSGEFFVVLFASAVESFACNHVRGHCSFRLVTVTVSVPGCDDMMMIYVPFAYAAPAYAHIIRFLITRRVFKTL